MKKILIIGCTMLVLFSTSLTFFDFADASSIDFEFHLRTGFNMITIPVTYNEMASTLADEISGCIYISHFDAQNQMFKSYIVGTSGYDYEIHGGMGIFVLVEDDVSFTLSGEPLSDVQFDLWQQKNLLGWYKTESTYASDVMDGISGCINVSTYDAIIQEDVYYNSPDDDNFAIEQGMGYFVTIDGGFEIDFNSGWNLITIPVETNWMASDLANNITFSPNIISEWDAEQQTYNDYIVGGPSGFDFELKEGYGLYVNIGGSGTLTVPGFWITDADVDLVKDQNLLGWYNSQITTASSIMSGIMGCTQVRMFDSHNQEYIYYNSSSDPDFAVHQGMGYWLVLETVIDELSPLDGITLTKPTFEEADLNGDGQITVLDLVMVSNHYGETVDPPGSESWDLDADGDVDYTDLDLVTWVGYGNLDLYVTFTNIKGETADVSFYWDDGTLIDTDTDVGSGDVAQVPFENIVFDTEYNWYVIIDDGIETTQSETWSFTLIEEDVTPPPTEPDPSLAISVDSVISESDDFQVTITSDNSTIESATIGFNGGTYSTDSEGIVVLTAPSVESDTSFTITASKTGYTSAQTSVLIQNQQQQSTIQLIFPNHGGTLSGINDISWIVSNPPTNPYVIKVQYRYKNGNWGDLSEVASTNSEYSWDTTTMSDGYPYLVKVILKEDADSDGIYETAVSYDSSDSQFEIDNSVLHLGEIFGQVTDNSNNPLEDVRVYIILSDQDGVVTSKSTLTDANGNYNVQISKGNYDMKFSKNGYQKSTSSGVAVWTNEATQIDTQLTPIQTEDPSGLPIITYENRDLIDEGIKNNTIGGEITVQYNETEIDFNKYVYIYNNVSISTLEVEKNNLSFLINGDENCGGRTVVINLDEGVIDFSKDFVIEYDGEPMEMADDISDILNPNDDGSHPEYLITIGANGTQILVSIPHFSEHKISIYALSLEEIVETVMQYKEVAIFAGFIVIALASVVMFRKGKDH